MTGLEVRPAQETDRTSVRRVVEAAFGEEGERVADLVEALHAARRVQLSLVAEVDGAVAGHVQLNHSWVDAREALVDVLVLSPLSVAPAHQRSGLGTTLVATALAAARESGAPAVFLEGAPGYYGARGFGRASEHGFERPSVRIPDPAFQVALLPAHEAWMTGRLVYCDPFWAHDCVGLRDPLLAELEERLG
ncbi:GNAT family N-acetyltransferase [Nocardioides panaciterrulae]|uniref:Putative acetyltransferase n=1 Tax=Nocardioides panaciterrulae TaxID=661492 RepID=A0A7Y9E5I0_9ACTN|nr:putative acetyltransferase [Nocardioides panaciterrulae]